MPIDSMITSESGRGKVHSHKTWNGCRADQVRRCECTVPDYAFFYRCCGWYCGFCGGALRKRFEVEKVHAPSGSSTD